MVTEITLDELKGKIEAGDDFVLAEILPPDYYAEAHLPGAVNLPLDRLEALAPQLIASHDADVVVYCKNTPCQNSGLAARRLQRLGYTNVRDFVGGKADWIAAGLPVERELAAAA